MGGTAGLNACYKQDLTAVKIPYCDKSNCRDVKPKLLWRPGLADKQKDQRMDHL